jgi:hypothetical protein
MITTSQKTKETAITIDDQELEAKAKTGINCNAFCDTFTPAAKIGGTVAFVSGSATFIAGVIKDIPVQSNLALGFGVLGGSLISITLCMFGIFKATGCLEDKKISSENDDIEQNTLTL